MANPLNIFYPNGSVEGVQVFIWDVATLQPKVWDGSLSTGALTIEIVNQGAAGASPWPIKIDSSGNTVQISGQPLLVIAI